MELDKELIRNLTTTFVHTARTELTAPEDRKVMAGGSVGLKRNDDSWTLEFIRGRKTKKGVYVTWVDLPDDIFELRAPDFWVAVATIIAIKLANSMNAINANARRTPELRKELSENAYKTRLTA